MLLSGCSTQPSVSTPLPPTPQNPPPVAKATVILKLGCSKDSPKTSCYGVSADRYIYFSLGTLVEYSGFSGIITHDHYGDVENVASNFNELTEYDWVEFIGFKGCERINSDELQQTGLRVVPGGGALSISYSGIRTIGDPVGISQQSHPTGTSAYYAFVNPNILLGQAPSTTITDVFHVPSKNSMQYVVTFDNSRDDYRSGDSGGGLFDIYGNLIGVNWLGSPEGLSSSFVSTPITTLDWVIP